MIATDFAVIGAGIAGASVAYELSARAQVQVLEREPQAGYHATGRSAALFSEIYGNPLVRALSRAGRRFLFEPPAGFTNGPLLLPRGVLYIASAEQRQRMEEFRRAPDVARDTRELSAVEALRMVPILRESSVAHCAYEPAAMDVEAHGLHQGYLQGLRARGGRVVTNCAIESIRRTAQGWSIVTGGETINARVLINAAGAWADEMAHLAGVRPIGIEPKRRTALLLQPPAGLSVERWPMVIDIDEAFWLVGQGGYGFQTAPALSRVAAALARGCEIDSDIREQGVTVEALSPARLRM